MTDNTYSKRMGLVLVVWKNASYTLERGTDVEWEVKPEVHMAIRLNGLAEQVRTELLERIKQHLYTAS